MKKMKADANGGNNGTFLIEKWIELGYHVGSWRSSAGVSAWWPPCLLVLAMVNSIYPKETCTITHKTYPMACGQEQ